ncbi:nucleotidyltransferase family protein [Halobacillus rhizosphaerae]|uniref:nucleotidyltransferase family protein n=1 Tax=Halobacillus rhizosphaerae TaxID=3064889 RepID=UPI00398B736E
MIRTKEEFLQLVNIDEDMMHLLKTVKSLHLPDWWVCAGFVRSKIWDYQHGFKEKSKLPDVDVIYFHKSMDKESEDVRIEEHLKSLHPDVPWSVKNQARMHLKNGFTPYQSSYDAISKFPETATSLGLSLDKKDNLVLAAPHGLEDAIHMEVRPTPYFKHTHRIHIYTNRVKKKNWQDHWHNLTIYMP